MCLFGSTELCLVAKIFDVDFIDNVRMNFYRRGSEQRGLSRTVDEAEQAYHGVEAEIFCAQRKQALLPREQVRTASWRHRYVA